MYNIMPIGVEQAPRVHLRQGALPARGGLAVWQQGVLAAYIERHLADPVRVGALARLVYMGSNYFSRAFKQSFGMPPHRYLVHRRVERAKALLAVPTWSVTDIGVLLGFSGTSSFSAAFRQVTGTTPMQYRLTSGLRPGASATPHRSTHSDLRRRTRPAHAFDLA